MQNETEVTVRKCFGGGTSWYYAIRKRDGYVLGASHEDDKEGMKRLEKIKTEYKEAKE